MSTRKFNVGHIAIVVTLAGGAAVAQASILQFDIMGRSGPGLRFDNENPNSAVSTATGGEVGTGILYDNVTRILTVNVGWGSGNGFTDLSGPVTVAHIHAAANALFTSNGGVIFNMDGLTPGFNGSATSGGWTNTTQTLSLAQETQLLNGFLYFNVHTNRNPGGEIRGNLVLIPAPGAAALLGLGGLVATRRRRR